MTSIDARAQVTALALERFNKSLKGQALESSIYSLTSSVLPAAGPTPRGTGTPADA